MPVWLATLLAGALTGAGTLFGGMSSKQKTSSTTDPFYALMSPYSIGQVLNRFGALSGAGFPSGAINTLSGKELGQNIWAVIQKQWPNIMKGLKV